MAEQESEDNMDTLDGNSSLAECSICLDIIQNLAILPCQHNFCFSCIILWSAEKFECPLCHGSYCSLKAMGMDITLIPDKIGGKVRGQSSVSSQHMGQEFESHQVLSSHVLRNKLVDICTAVAFCNPAVLQYRQSLYHENRWTDSSLSSVNLTVPYLEKDAEFLKKFKRMVVRELSVLLHKKEQICLIAELIFQLALKFEIRSNAFETRLKPFLLPHILQFLNEIHHFASTPLIRHDVGTESCKTEIHILSGIIKTEIQEDDSEPSTSFHSNAEYSASASETFENMLTTRSSVIELFNDAVLNRRNHIYKYNLWSKLDISTVKYEHIFPSFLKKNIEYVIRLIPWLVRELFVILRNLDQVHDVMHTIVSLLITHELWSEAFHWGLHPHLSGLTRHFIHELFHLSSTPGSIWDYDVFTSYEYREYRASSSFDDVPVQFRTDFSNKLFPVYHLDSLASNDEDSLFVPGKTGPIPFFDIPFAAAKNSMNISSIIKNFVQIPEDRSADLQPPYCKNTSHSVPCELAIPACIFSPEALLYCQTFSSIPITEEPSSSDVEYVDLVSDSDSSSNTMEEESSEEIEEPDWSNNQYVTSSPQQMSTVQ